MANLNWLKCEVCGKQLGDEHNETMFAEIRRGYFSLHEDDDELHCDRIKCNLYICPNCYLNDPDFCRFMNKIGYNIR